jgi:hypothetical protein
MNMWQLLLIIFIMFRVRQGIVPATSQIMRTAGTVTRPVARISLPFLCVYILYFVHLVYLNTVSTLFVRLIEIHQET